MSLNPSGDRWCRKSDEAIAGLPGVLKLVDDILVHAPSLVELRGRIQGVLQRCRAHGIILSKKKFVMVDRFSGYPFVQCLSSTTAGPVTRALAGWWELFGFPSVIRADHSFGARSSWRSATRGTSSWKPPARGRMGWRRPPSRTAKNSFSSASPGGGTILMPCSSVVTALARMGSRQRSYLFGLHMRLALPAAARAFEPVSLGAAEEMRKKTHDTNLAEIGNHRLKKFHDGDGVWVQNWITGLGQGHGCAGQRNGSALFSIYFPDSEKISWRNKRFLP